MNRPHPPIVGVFDSGVGGLSILTALRRTINACRFVYVCDQEFFPYGLQSEEELTRRVEQLCQQVLAQFPLDYVVIACNTASTVVLPRLRGQLQQAVIGVVPAIKPAAQLSRSKVIGLLATPGTIERAYTQELIALHASNCTVLKLGSTRLVELAEAKLRGELISSEEIATILRPLSQDPLLDTLVLGCTHFPHLLEELQAAFPRPITMVEPSEAIARRLLTLMEGASHISLAEHEARDEDILYVTGPPLPASLIQAFNLGILFRKK